MTTRRLLTYYLTAVVSAALIATGINASEGRTTTIGTFLASLGFQLLFQGVVFGLWWKMWHKA